MAAAKDEATIGAVARVMLLSSLGRKHDFVSSREPPWECTIHLILYGFAGVQQQLRPVRAAVRRLWTPDEFQYAGKIYDGSMGFYYNHNMSQIVERPRE